jgi:hypothetical protein
VNVVRVRRRNARRITAGLATGCVVLVAAVMGLRTLSPTPSAPAARATGAMTVASLDDPTTNEQADPLGYMFPDAASLTRFDSAYFPTDSAGNNNLLSDAVTDNDGE